MIFLDTLLIFGICILLILSVFVFKTEKSNSRSLLLAIFLLVCITLVNEYAIIHHLKQLTFYTNFIAEGSGFLLAPLLYTYVRSLVRYASPITSMSYGYFVPYAVHVVCITIPLAYHGFGLPVVQRFIEHLLTHWDILFVIESLFFLGLTLKAYRKLAEHQENIKAYYSNLQKRGLTWTEHMLVALMVYQGVNLSMTAFVFISGSIQFNDDFILMINTIIICAYLGYNGLFQTQIFLPDHLSAHLKAEKPNPVKPKNQTLNKQLDLAPNIKLDFNGLEDRINQCFKEGDLHLNPQLTLRDLAETVEVKEKELSGYINQQMHTTFYELVNAYRIEAFKNQIHLTNKLTVMGLAEQCGFKSKTSFYRIFKKTTGQTPAEFKRDKH